MIRIEVRDDQNAILGIHDMPSDVVDGILGGDNPYHAPLDDCLPPRLTLVIYATPIVPARGIVRYPILPTGTYHHGVEGGRYVVRDDNGALVFAGPPEQS